MGVQPKPLNNLGQSILDELQTMGCDVPYADLYAAMGDMSEAHIKRQTQALIKAGYVSWRVGHGKLRLMTAEHDRHGRPCRPDHVWDDGSDHAMRDCISCGVSFPSTHKGHRRCDRCKYNEARNEDVAPGWEFVAA
jgi:hypothetical protein